eukprot:TRINITY_DN4294_c4_g1_i1.p1 TRINITY_DN4294_c4_g1~~TRINITY_DN4294_c4_g1_i1.p1  ORF type:complete len:1838 (+),score=725.27 TRINITY_DN4294_c4_g1_i1:34-5547(+)
MASDSSPPASPLASPTGSPTGSPTASPLLSPTNAYGGLSMRRRSAPGSGLVSSQSATGRAPKSHRDRLRAAAEGAAAAKRSQQIERRRASRRQSTFPSPSPTSALSVGSAATPIPASPPSPTPPPTAAAARQPDPYDLLLDEEDDLDMDQEEAGAQVPRDDWPHWRNTLRVRVIGTGHLERATILVIVANSIALAFEEQGPDANNPAALRYLDVMFTCLYVTEFGVKFAGLGLWGHKESYFGFVKEIETVTGKRKGTTQKRLRPNWWNLLDFVVMVTGVLALLIPAITSTDAEGGPLSGLRVFRLLRPLKAVNALPEMRILMRSILQALPRLLNMLILFCLLLLTLGIIAVQTFKGVLRQRCFPLEWLYPVPAPPMVGYDADQIGRVCCRNATDADGIPVRPRHAEGYICPWGTSCAADSRNFGNRGKMHFDNIGSAVLGLTVSVTLEGWTDLMYNVMDAGSLYASIFFVALVIIGAFFVMNLTIVIVNNVFEYNIAYERAKQRQRIQGTRPRSGSMRPDSVQPRTMVEWPKSKDATQKLWWRRGILGVVSQSFFDNVMFVVILGNIVALGMWHHGQSDDFENTLKWLNFFFTLCFCGEATLKLLGYGPRAYFTVMWNVFDFFIVVVSVVQFAIENPFDGGGGSSTATSLKTLQVFRAIQVVRVLKLTRQSRRLQRWARVFVQSIKATVTLTALLALIVFIYALLGTQLFAGSLCGLGKETEVRQELPSWIRPDAVGPPASGSCEDLPRANFETIGASALSLFIVLSGEDWQFIMYDAMKGAGDVSSLYFISWYFIGNNLLLNLFISILIARVTEVRQEDEDLKRLLKELRGNRRGRHIPVFPGSVSMPTSPTAGDSRTLTECLEQGLRKMRVGVLARVLDLLIRPRQLVAKLVCHPAFETAIMTVIVVSCITLAMYLPLRAPDTATAVALERIDFWSTMCFFAEAVLKIFAFGFVVGEDTYLQRDNWNRLDFTIVVSSLVSILSAGAGSVANIKALRILRVLRPLRFINKSKGLKVALASLFSAIPSLGMVMVLGSLGWLVFAILGVQLFGGTFYACTRSSWNDMPEYSTKAACLNYTGDGAKPTWSTYSTHFDNIFYAFLSLFEMASLEGWVEVMNVAVDSSSHEEGPHRNARAWVSSYFVCFVLMGSFFIVNLFVSALVDSFQEQRRGHLDGGDNFITEEQQEWITMQKLLFRHIRPPIHADPVKGIPRWRRLAVVVVAHSYFEAAVNTAVVLNVAVLASEHYAQPEAWKDGAELVNDVLVMLFSLEALLKVLAYTPRGFWLNPWNRFDLLIVVISVVGVVVSKVTAAEAEDSSATDVGGVASVFRALRLLRLLRLLNAAKGVQALLRTLFLTLPTMMNISGIVLLILFCYAVLGVFLFGRTRHGPFLQRYATFEDLPRALLLLLRIATGEAWPGIMHDSIEDGEDCSKLDECGSGALLSYLYYVSFVVICTYVFLNLFIAVLLDSFNDAVDVGDQLVTDEEMEHFFDVWRTFDPLQSCTICFDDLPRFLKTIGPPLGPDPSSADDAGIIVNYISHMKNAPTVRGKIHQDKVVSALFQIAFKNATGTVLRGKQLKEFEKMLSRVLQAKWRDQVIRQGEEAGLLKQEAVRNHPLVEAHMAAVWIQAVFRGKIARARLRMGQACSAVPASPRSMLESFRLDMPLSGTASDSASSSAEHVQFLPRAAHEEWTYDTSDSAETSDSACGAADAAALSPSPARWPGPGQTGQYSTYTPLRRKRRRGLGEESRAAPVLAPAPAVVAAVTAPPLSAAALLELGGRSPTQAPCTRPRRAGTVGLAPLQQPLLPPAPIPPTYQVPLSGWRAVTRPLSGSLPAGR